MCCLASSDHQPQCRLAQPDGVGLATCVGTEPPRCGTQGHVPGGAEQAASISRHAPLRCLPGSGTQGQRQPRCSQTSHLSQAAAARPPTSPRLPRLSQSLVTPHQHYGVARQPEPGAGAVPQPCRWNTEPDAWDGTSRPAGHVCASGEATFGLAHCVSASTDACPPSLGRGHVCGAAGLPDPCPAVADGQSWTHPGPLPAFLGAQGNVVRVQSWKGLHPSLCLTSHFHTDFI